MIRRESDCAARRHCGISGRQHGQATCSNTDPRQHRRRSRRARDRRGVVHPLVEPPRILRGLVQAGHDRRPNSAARRNVRGWTTFGAAGRRLRQPLLRRTSTACSIRPSFGKPSHAWQVTFDAADEARPIIVQHMLAGVNAHIGLDLGVVAEEMSSGLSLLDLREDFDRINAVLASQGAAIVEDINELSPVLADVFAVLRQNEINLINGAVKSLRDDAWRFALVAGSVAGDHRSDCHRAARSADCAARRTRYSRAARSPRQSSASRRERAVTSCETCAVLDEIASVPAQIRLTL